MISAAGRSIGVAWREFLQNGLFCLHGMKLVEEINENTDQSHCKWSLSRACRDAQQNALSTTETRSGSSRDKRRCGIGDCGACTVIMNGRAVNSCLVLAAQADGSDITTIEGVSEGEKLHPIQQAFVEHGSAQCGFCTPGMILSAKNLLDKNLDPSEQDVRVAIAGNLCRCTGYQKIVEAVLSASKAMKDRSPS